MIHSEKDCKVKCEAIKNILTNIQHMSATNYEVRHQAESALDLIRDLKGEFDVEEK